MTIVVKDRVQETTGVTGTGTMTLAGAVQGFQSFAAIGNGNTTYYTISDPTSGDWEVGIGTYSTTGPTLTRTTVLSSSNAGALVSFAAGTKNVFCTYPAEKAIYEEITGNVLIDGGPITVVGTGVSPGGYTTFSAALGEMYANINSFAQFYSQNYSNGSEASADFVAYNNLGDGSTHYVDMGINSSNYNSLTYPIFTGNSAYVFNDGGEFFLGSATDDVVLFAGGVDVADEAVRIDKTTKEVTTAAGMTLGGALTGVGGTFTSPVTTTSTSVTSPANNEFVTKAYVDNATSTGIHIHEPVAAETSAALSAVYTQGGTTFNITDITGTNTVVTSTTHGLSVDDEIWLYSTAGNGLSINTPYFVYATPTTTSLQLTASWNGPLLTGLTNASGLSYATRANSGVGAYLEASANATLPISGVSVSDRVLVYQQATGYWNGVYTVTSLGSGASKWKLTRAADADYYSPSDTNGLSEGDYFYVQSNAESYVLTTPGLIIIGYTGITYTLFSSVPVYTGTSPINVTGTTISLTTVPATLGGTGQSTVTTGDLLYGSATNTWSKLALGATYRVLVSDAGGIPQWGAVALNQSGSVSGALPAVNGGTGIASYTQGEMLYANTTTTLDVVTANASTTKKFLSQTGTGSAAQAPVWGQPAASDITGLAPSATTDTTNASNISSGTLPSGRLTGSYTGITGVGTLAAGTWNGSTIAAAYGGTGQSSYAVGDLLYADTTTSLAKLADVAVGNALISGGVSSAPSWGKIGLATHVSGTLPIANGGTGSTSTQYVNLASNVTGTLPVANGGTGSSSTTLTANYFFASPNGSTGSPSFRAIVAADIPTLNQNTTGTAAGLSSTLAISSGGTGQTTANAAFNALAPSQATNAGKYLTTDGTNTSWATLGGGAALSNDTSTASNLYPMFAAATSGTPTTVYTSNAKLLYKPSTGEFQSSILTASNGIMMNSQTIATSMTIPVGYSGTSSGPVSIASGQSVTVSSGSRWVVV